MIALQNYGKTAIENVPSLDCFNDSYFFPNTFFSKSVT